jgi:hypothetical protein
MKTQTSGEKLIATIQTAINELKVPEFCEGKMRGEYVKCGMRLAIEAINAAIAKHKTAAAMPNDQKLSHGHGNRP